MLDKGDNNCEEVSDIIFSAVFEVLRNCMNATSMFSNFLFFTFFELCLDPLDEVSVLASNKCCLRHVGYLQATARSVFRPIEFKLLEFRLLLIAYY